MSKLLKIIVQTTSAVVPQAMNLWLLRISVPFQVVVHCIPPEDINAIINNVHQQGQLSYEGQEEELYDVSMDVSVDVNLPDFATLDGHKEDEQDKGDGEDLHNATMGMPIDLYLPDLTLYDNDSDTGYDHGDDTDENSERDVSAD